MIDPRNESLCFETWLQVFVSLHQSKFLHQAAEVVVAWYDQLNELQAKHATKYHKGGAAHNAGVGLLRIDGRRIGSTMNQPAHDTNIR